MSQKQSKTHQHTQNWFTKELIKLCKPKIFYHKFKHLTEAYNKKYKEIRQCLKRLTEKQ